MARKVRGSSPPQQPQQPPLEPIPDLESQVHPWVTKGVVLGTVAIIAAASYFTVTRRDTEVAIPGIGPKSVPVVVEPAKAESLPMEIRTTGNVQPFSIVNVVPRVGGQIVSVHFVQGQTVKEHDLLFEIDTEPSQAALDQAKGNLARDLAQVKVSEANLERDQASLGQLQANLHKDQASLRYAELANQRYKQLATDGAISLEQADQAFTSAATAQAQIEADKKQLENAQAVLHVDGAQVATAKATLQADQAAVHQAQIQVDWCKIRAPIDGRTGTLLVHKGNVVAANYTTPLVTIAQVKPIYISFTVPEDHLDDVRQALSQGSLKIQAMINGVKANYVSGTASFLENTVNTSSGTALLRATFANEDLKLFPGQYVVVVATMPAEGSATVIPAQAVQSTQQGDAVYVIDSGNKARLAPVEVKRMVGDSAVIGKGITPGELVVIDGASQLTPGTVVKIGNRERTSKARKQG